MSIHAIAAFLPNAVASQITAKADQIKEIRLRADRPVQLVCTTGDLFLNEELTAQQLRRIALAMMEHSYYARESELAHGYFTMKNGCRVGVCGSFTERASGDHALRAIGSLCIRIARAIPGCAGEIVSHMTSDGLQSALILSRPGLGKTTLLRDAARTLSETGYTVGIADERREIAACKDGVPTMDVGPRTDVVDGCPKAQAIEQLIRAMSPQVIITDEIGNACDAAAVQEAARMGVTILASAHAADFEEFEAGSMGILVKKGLFRMAFLIDSAPGKIADMRRYGKGGIICSTT